MPITPGISQAAGLLNSLFRQGKDPSQQIQALQDPEAVISPADTILLQERTPVLKQLSGGPFSGWNAGSIQQKTVTGSILTINDALPYPLLGLTVGFEPVQAGSGDPNPTDNVRPITGWSGIHVYVGRNYPTADNTYSDTFPTSPGTVYGGTVDLATGVLTVTHNHVFCSHNDTWEYYSFANNVGILSATHPAQKTAGTPICDKFVGKNISGFQLQYGEISVRDTGSLAVKAPNSVTTDSEFLQWLEDIGGFTVVYELATPQTYQLDPVTITLLQNQINNLWSDANGTLTAKYYAEM